PLWRFFGNGPGGMIEGRRLDNLKTFNPAQRQGADRPSPSLRKGRTARGIAETQDYPTCSCQNGTGPEYFVIGMGHYDGATGWRRSNYVRGCHVGYASLSCRTSRI